MAPSLLILFLVFLRLMSSLAIHSLLSRVNVVLAGGLRVLHLNDDLVDILLFGDKEILVDDALGQALDLGRELASRGASETIGPAVLLLNLLDNLFLVDACHRVHVVLDVALWWVEVFAASLTDNMEAVNLWLVVVYLRWEDYSLFVVLQEMMRETCAEEGSVDRHRPKLWNIDLVAAWAENLESGDLQAVAESDGEYLLPIAESPWAGAVEAGEELVVDFGHTAR